MTVDLGPAGRAPREVTVGASIGTAIHASEKQATALLRDTGSSLSVAVYLAIAAAITLVAVVSMRETKGSSLHDLDRLDEERLAADRVAADA